jgi:hypothetical protein
MFSQRGDEAASGRMTHAVFDEALFSEPALLLPPLFEQADSTSAVADATTASETNELRFTSRSPSIAVSERGLAAARH